MSREKVLFIFIALFLVGQTVVAQNRTLQGIITSAEDGEPLIGAVSPLKETKLKVRLLISTGIIRLMCFLRLRL